MVGVIPSCNYPKKRHVETVNRLVLLGNGFDLAHGYKTRYTDFLFHYLNEVIEEFYSKDIFDDKLLRINYKGDEKFQGKSEVKRDINSVYAELMRIHNHRIATVHFKSILLQRILEKLGSNYNWVDIENEYYQLLKQFLRKNEKSQINTLNDSLDYITVKLESYLEKETSDSNAFSGNYFVYNFYEEVKKNEIVTVALPKDLVPESLHILNFNYTNTISKYTDSPNKIDNTTTNFIHGELNKKENPVVFGFGDELDENYLELEKKNDNKLFRHIKSFKYFKTRNYHNLIRFIDSNFFQVYVVGHSCGLSDRTMLNQIFEHENCISIKILFHQRDNDANDYIEKTHEISRHFKDKAMMRKKIVPEVNSYAIPKPRKLN